VSSRPHGNSAGRPLRLREPVAPKPPVSSTSAKLPGDDLKDDGIYLSLEYADIEMTGRDVHSIEIDQCRYKNVNFGQTKLDRALISDTAFEGCDLANVRARDSSLVRVTVSASRMTGFQWSEGGVRDAAFHSCRLDMTSFRFSTFKTVVFSDCNLLEVDFQEADLRGVRFERCDLTGAQFSKAQMAGARFSDCKMVGINGVLNLKGAIVSSRDALELAYTLAGALGISIQD
jgi:uncharacterized protein YjbI with pentapeptide repeats